MTILFDIGAWLLTFLSMEKLLLTVFVIASATLHIRAEYCGPRSHVYLFKPLTMVFVLLLAMRIDEPISSVYKYMIIAGFVCSIVGDIFLMLPKDHFIAGLVSFLIVHLFYIAAFTSMRGLVISWWSFAACFLYGSIMCIILWPHLGRMKWPVLAYMLVILIMVSQALERWVQIEQRGALLAFAGAVLFVISDSVLALNRFKGHFKSAQAILLSTYFTAQWLIALSIEGE